MSSSNFSNFPFGLPVRPPELNTVSSKDEGRAQVVKGQEKAGQGAAPSYKTQAARSAHADFEQCLGERGVTVTKLPLLSTFSLPLSPSLSLQKHIYNCL